MILSDHDSTQTHMGLVKSRKIQENHSQDTWIYYTWNNIQFFVPLTKWDRKILTDSNNGDSEIKNSKIHINSEFKNHK
jgi:hypothetical protein